MTNPTRAATYAHLFADQLADRCDPDALESNSGPIAYLHALFEQAQDIETTSSSDQRITLAQRRPDIAELTLDKESLTKQIPPLTLAINALTRQARAHLGEDKDLPRAISEAIYPVPLPFHFPWEQIRAVLRHKKLSLFELMQASEYDFPNFCYDQLHTEEIRAVMRNSTGFSPALKRLLLDDQPNTVASRFGDTMTTNNKDRTSVKTFCKRAGIQPSEIYDLLASSGLPVADGVAPSRVKQSRAYMPDVQETANGHLYGAAFINNARTPAVSLEIFRWEGGYEVEIANGTQAHLVRAHKLIHLRQALSLTFAETDLLLMAILRAEGQTQDFHLTEETLRALGVFRHFKESYGITAEQFAALVHEVSPYALKEETPFLDRLSSGVAAEQLADIEDQLIIDGSEFDLAKVTGDGSTGPSTQVVAQLCGMLRLEERMARTYVAHAVHALGDPKPRVSLALISSLYRQSFIPRLLHMTPDEGACLVAVLAMANQEIYKVLAGKPIITAGPDKVDILDLLVGLSNASRWLNRNNLRAQDLLKLLTPLPAHVNADTRSLFGMDDRIQKTLETSLSAIRTAVLSEARIKEALDSNARLKESEDWFSTLKDFVNTQGILIQTQPSTDDTLKTQLEAALKDKLQNPEQRQETASLLEALLIKTRIAQEDVTKHLISTAFDQPGGAILSANHVLPLLRWIGSSPHNVLNDLLTAAEKPGPSSAEQTEVQLTGLSFNLWALLGRYAQAIRITQLSPAGLEALVDHPEWFDLEEESSAKASSPICPELSLDLLYQLTRLNDWVTLCRDNGFEESDALAYFGNRPPSDQPDAIAQAAAELGRLLAWNPDEAVQAFPYISVPPTTGTKREGAPTPAVIKGSLDEFLLQLTPKELARYYEFNCWESRGIGRLVEAYYHSSAKLHDSLLTLVTKFKKFMNALPSSLKVRKSQNLPEFHPEYWGDILNHEKKKKEERGEKRESTKVIVFETIPDSHSHTLSDFIDALTSDERRILSKHRSIEAQIIRNYQTETQSSLSEGERIVAGKFEDFLWDNPGALRLTQQQYDNAFKPDEWRAIIDANKAKGDSPKRQDVLEFKVLNVPIEIGSSQVPCVPSSISDVDYMMRLKSVCSMTGLSCESVLSLAALDQASSYQAVDDVSRLLLGACAADARQKIESELQVLWRDALAGFLRGHWVYGNDQISTMTKASEDLSWYFLTDIDVSWEAKTTTRVGQAISSLQHYLYRLFSHLEPGYEQTSLPPTAVEAWQRYLSQYGSWKQWRSQINNPENLIYYANRPNKSAAFKELEVELNQGKLDVSLLDIAVCSYLTKFERLGNLQIVSGYLEGLDPKNDTYHLIGKTNTSPPEYYWRSVDMSLRDNQERISPLAWTEWTKITLTTSGVVAQSIYVDEEKTETRCDAIRPLILAGRRYVFWVERRGSSDTGADQKAKEDKQLSVQYAYQQSDGFWSPPNELMSLGNDALAGSVKKAEGKNSSSAVDRYIPGLIAFINTEDKRSKDPWLTVILYNCDPDETALAPKNNPPLEQGKDYFIEMRDLLLVDKQTLDDLKTKTLVKGALASYKDLRNIQHPYDGNTKTISCEFKEKTLPGRRDVPRGYGLSGSEIKIEAIPIAGHRELNITLSLDGRMSKPRYGGDPYCIVHLEMNTPGEGTPTPVFSETVGRDTDIWVSGKTDIKGDGEYQFTYWITIEGAEQLRQASTFIISTVEKAASQNIKIQRNRHQSQYLDLVRVATQKPALPYDYVRLNTLFGKHLVARASQSVARVLTWDTQKLPEPEIRSDNKPLLMDFHGANGLYFRELFLYLPHLIATRLTEQQQFEEAENWYLRHLFDPYRPQPSEDGRPPYWNTRPLAEAGTLKSTLRGSVDPTARAFVLSRYYQQAVVLSLIENWQREGDHYYRQLNLSSLNHAWLCYQQALHLIGPLDAWRETTWQPHTLSALKAGSFQVPINQRLTDNKKTLEHRLFNLRHGLTIDGKALPNLNWNNEGGDPFGLAKGGLSIIPNSYNSDHAAIPAYRFRQLLPSARAAVQQLLDLGRHYMKLMEDEFNTSLSVLLKTQEIRISDFTLRMRREDISGVQAKRRGLEIGRSAAEFRSAYYANLIAVGRSPREEAATAMTWLAHAYRAASVPTAALAAGVEGLVPTIFGTSFGGAQPAAIAKAGARAMEVFSDGAKILSDQLKTESDYERRANGWQFEMDQAQWDLKLIDQEIAETDVELNAATISLEESRQERANLEEAYVAMTTGFTIIPIYNWLVARQELLYGAAYDAVLSMCLSLEAAWRYEIGDYKREAFIKTSAWSDSYKGMLAGESLLVDLQQMENAYLLANERRLTIKKSFSLLKLLGESNWVASVETLAENRPLSFDLNASDFDKHYPGHYLRQLKHVSVSFMLKDGATLDGLSAILTQTSNVTLVEPNKDGVEYLYKKGNQVPPSVKRNLRAHQQIALSSLVSEDGMGYSPGEWVYELMFHDGRYLPFEGTGAISQWTLEIPDEDFAKSLITKKDGAIKEEDLVIKDIQINLVYTSLNGGPDLIKMTQETLKQPETEKPLS